MRSDLAFQSHFWLHDVPRIASFDGLVVKMFFNDHPPPHSIVWPGDVDLDPDVIYAALDLGPDRARVYVLTPSTAA
jgi:hypothetical protein